MSHLMPNSVSEGTQAASLALIRDNAMTQGITSGAQFMVTLPMNKPSASVYDETVAYAFYRAMTLPDLRPVTLKCIASIFYNFFFRQFRAAYLPGRAPVSQVDLPLDKKIPFTPSWVTIYLDFVPFWIRMVAFLLRKYGRKAHNALMDFISSMGKLYAYAAGVYKKNFSTTVRPFYIARPRFFLIHMVDPHLMCIPSLHVMIAIRTYTKFMQIMKGFGDDKTCAAQIEEIRQGALAITRAILYIKQHSINCISAALYAMTCYDPELFTQEDAEAFTAELFSGKQPKAEPGRKLIAEHPASAPRSTIKADDANEIQGHIIGLFRRFLSEKKETENWDEPLMKFLREMPAAKS